ncbi:MAG: FAD-dependent oxidoreductase, partial [Pseudomonadota bacterium]
MQIGIVGCGIAGMAAALFLARQGHAVTLFERFERARPLGAGFLLQPTGMGVLASLGLLPQILSKGAPIDRLHGRTTGGHLVCDLRYADYRQDTR